MRFSVIFVALVLAAQAVVPVFGGAVTLASKGKTDYTIVLRDGATTEECAAAKDFQWHLNRITGAKFALNGEAPRRIFVGIKAPDDTAPLAPYERRVRTDKDGNVYIYGNGRQGNVFAIYDFLEKFFDCRWYTFFGDAHIPRKRNAVFPNVELSVIPSFDTFSIYGNDVTHDSVAGSAFRRRARIYDLLFRANDPVPLLGSDGPHVLSGMLPPLVPNTPPGGKWPVNPPLKYFEGREYFKTNPEFFSMDKQGRRVPFYQVCFSNPELRRTLIENYRTVIKHEYKGGPALMTMDLNDKGSDGAPCCYCPECKKLNDQYGTPAGSYWDFVAEACGIFAQEFPGITFKASSYQITVPLPTNGFKLPPNFLVKLAPLAETDFLKPYRKTPRVYHMIEALGKFAARPFMLEPYPTTYPRPLFTYPLVANIDRLVMNMRDAHKLGVRMIEAEFGCGPHGDMGFNELRVYLLSQLARNVDCNVPALIDDFMKHYYGAAAPMMRKYLAELEECEKNEKNYMRYDEDHRSALSYLTPANLLKWQSDFDKMEQLTSDDARANLHVRRARTNLDEATMSVWYKFAPGQMPDRDLMYARYKKTLKESFEDIFRTLSPAKVRKSRIRRSIERRDLSMYYHYACSGKWRELPAEFAALPADRVHRVVPYLCRKPFSGSRLSDDPEAAVKLAARLKIPAKKCHFLCYRWERPDIVHENFFELSLTPEQLRANAGKGYKTYYVGTSRLWPDAQLINNMGKGVGFATGYLFDPANPEQRYDFHISLKVDPDGENMWCDEMILVKSDKLSTLRKDSSEP